MDFSDHLGKWGFLIIIVAIIAWVTVVRIVDPPSERVDSGYVCTESYSLNTGPGCH